MVDFFNFLETHWNGILILIILVFVLLFVINWLARIFRWGRYKTRSQASTEYMNVSYIISQFFANIIDDFKHLLALVIVIIFTGLIIYSMTTAPTFDQKMEALQLVIASLGGLLGSIIGYYFGESAARSNQVVTTTTNTIPSNQNVVNLPDEEIIPAPEINIQDPDQAVG